MVNSRHHAAVWEWPSISIISLQFSQSTICSDVAATRDCIRHCRSDFQCRQIGRCSGFCKWSVRPPIQIIVANGTTLQDMKLDTSAANTANTRCRRRYRHDHSARALDDRHRWFPCVLLPPSCAGRSFQPALLLDNYARDKMAGNETAGKRGSSPDQSPVLGVKPYRELRLDRCQ